VRSIRRARPMSGRRVAAANSVAPRFTRALAVVFVALAATLAFFAAPGLAATGHKFLPLSQLKEAAPGSPLAAEAIAIDGKGNVFVVATEEVDVFNSEGVLKTQFGAGVLEGPATGIAVDAIGRVYVAEATTVDVFKPNGSGGYEALSKWSGAGTPEKSFGELSSVAVDNSAGPSAGDVYIVDKTVPAVYVFKPQPEAAEEASFLTTLSLKPELEELGAVAVSATTGKAYVAGTKTEAGIVEVFSPAQKFETKLTGKGAPGGGLGPLGPIALEEATGDVYVVDTEAGAVDQVNPAGEWIGWLAAGPNGSELGPTGVASAPSGNVYVASAGNGVVDVFGPNLMVPDVKTGAGKSSKSKPLVVTLSGTVNPLGKAKYHFEYGQNREFTANTTTVELSGTTEQKVSATIPGLKPGTTYEFRLVAEGEEGVSNYGATVPFTTAEAVAGVTTGPVSEVTPTSATLAGSLEPQGFTTTYYFEWGETTLYGRNSPVPFAITSGTGVVPVETKLTGLKPAVTYHYRLAASNQFGISYGGDGQFTTAGPGITTVPASPVSPTEETLNANIDPTKLKTRVHFDYGENTGYGKSSPEEKLGESPQAVKATIKELKLATTYHFRVVVSIENEKGEITSASTGPDQEFTTALIESESATALSAETALLQAEINPFGKTASCQFEYGASPTYGASVPCDPASSKATAVFSGHIKELAANATYHYRVTVTVEGIAEKANGRDHTFTTLASGTVVKLPDGRAYEMVSPPNKQAGYIEPITLVGGAIQASEDGNAFAYIVNGPVAEQVEGNRSPEPQQVLATRGAKAWSSQEIVPPHERPAGLRAGNPDEYLLFSSDLSLAVVQPFPFALTPYAEPPLSPPATEAERKPCPGSSSERPCQEKTIYMRANAQIAAPNVETAKEADEIYEQAGQNGEILAKEHGEAAANPGYLPLVSDANVAPGTKFGGKPESQTAVTPALEFLDATPDLTHAVFLSTAALAPHAPSASGLYEWAVHKLQLVSLLPNGEPAPELAGQVKVSLGFSFENKLRGANFRHAISEDGSRVIWTREEVGPVGHLYVRDTAKQETLQLDSVAEGLPKPEKGEARFQIASANGSKIFFTDPQRLTADSTAGPEKPDLYECELEEAGGKLECKEGPDKERLKDLTVDHNAGESAAVQGLVLGASEDGSYVYFVAKGALAGSAEGGADNLYELHYDGTNWTTTFIAQLSSEDAPDWSIRAVTQLLMDLTARVSPDGHYLAFMSDRSLTGYNNIDVNEETGKHADEEVFLYKAGTPSPTCVSCNPSGARPQGVFDTEFAGEGAGLVVDKPQIWMSEGGNTGRAHWLAGSIPGWTTLSQQRAIYQSRYLSDSGRLFFNSADALVPEAAGDNRKETIEGKEATVGVENVYEYQPNEVGSCRASSGCVALISSGTSGKESAFLDASANGNDVYFLTAAKLLPQDEDTSFDVYDARVCGESGCQPVPEPAAAPCGSIPSCRGEAPQQPTFAPPAAFSGPGNTPHKVGGGGTLPTKVTKLPAKPLTNAQKLARALKACHKLPRRTHAQKKKRATCESQARKKYGAKKAKRSTRRAR
jgi:hypothetical protein